MRAHVESGVQLHHYIHLPKEKPRGALPQARAFDVHVDGIPDVLHQDQRVGSRITRRVGSLPKELVAARDIFFAQSSKERKSAVAYDHEMDTILYRVLKEQRGTSSYEASKQALDDYISMQLETHLGERLNVGISRFVYRIVDGQLVSEHTQEPVLDMIRRGRDYRRNHGKATDRAREDAEVIGFSDIEDVMTDEHTPPGTMMLYVSLPGDLEEGSNYPSNIYEVHQKTFDGRDIAYRFTSGLTAVESHERLSHFDAWYQRSEVPTDAQFIAKPIRIDPALTGLTTPEEVHQFMHKDHPHLNQEDFVLIKKACEPLIRRYLDSLAANPDDVQSHIIELRRLLNYADNSHKHLQALRVSSRGVVYQEGYYNTRPWVAPRIDLDALGRQKVKFVAGGCGKSGDDASAMSAAEFDPDRKGDKCSTCGKKATDSHYHCPGCTKTYASEKGKASEDMTQKCGCGFEFHCGKPAASDTVDRASLSLAA